MVVARECISISSTPYLRWTTLCDFIWFKGVNGFLTNGSFMD